jgi:hypothetical protein
MAAPAPSVGQLDRALAAVGDLIAGVQDEQWSAPTPCSDWTVRELVNHLVGMNLVFAALLREQAPPERGSESVGDDLVGAYRESGTAMKAAFDQSGVLERTFHGPLAQPPARTGYRYASMTFWPTAGTSLRPPANALSYLMTWPSRRWRLSAINWPPRRAPAASLPPRRSQTMHPRSIDWPPSLAALSYQPEVLTAGAAGRSVRR